MFCNPFYCPYAEYTLKDREAFGSLLSSADKKQKRVAPMLCNFYKALCGVFPKL